MNTYGTAYADDMVTLLHGDCRVVMACDIADASVDAIVTDPPYELAFMGKGWDASGIAYDADVWANAYRVLKPGGHLLAFGGTRTWHRLAVAIEDAGFEIRDSIAWMYGSGFPKSLDVSKAIDKARKDESKWQAVGKWLKVQRTAAGFSRQSIAPLLSAHKNLESAAANMSNWENGLSFPTWERWLELKDLIGFGDDMDAEVWRLNGRKGQPGEAWAEREVVGKGYRVDKKTSDVPISGATPHGHYDITAPATPAAQQWQGWGTALKPAFEPIVVARKPLIGTVAENVLTHGTGALNIDGGRIGTADVIPNANNNNIRGGAYASNTDGRDRDTTYTQHTAGRWPANVILDESQAAELDRQSGVGISKQAQTRKPMQRQNNEVYGKGLGTIDPDNTYCDAGGASRFFYVAKANSAERPRDGATAHPTVKPLDLMRYLVKLVTPPGGVVLEPFAGSGTTVEACLIEGFRCIAIELTDEYLPLIQQRIAKPIEQVLL